MKRAGGKRKIKGLYKPLVPIADTNIVAHSKGLNVVDVFMNSHLGIMAKGMKKVLEQYGMSASDVKPGNCLVFVNPSGKYIKVLIGTGDEYPVIAAHYFKPGQRFPIEAVRDIAKAFNSPSDVDANTKLKSALETYYKRQEVGH